MTRIQVDLLGDCRAVRLSDGQEITFRTRKARCLMGLLLISPNSRMNREQLASLLWDPAPEALARSSLRQALKELREVLGPDADLVLLTQALNAQRNVRGHRQTCPRHAGSTPGPATERPRR